MVTVIIEIIFAMLKKLYRFFGPAVFVALVLVIEIIAIPTVTDERARSEALHRDPIEVILKRYAMTRKKWTGSSE